MNNQDAKVQINRAIGITSRRVYSVRRAQRVSFRIRAARFLPRLMPRGRRSGHDRKRRPEIPHAWGISHNSRAISTISPFRRLFSTRSRQKMPGLSARNPHFSPSRVRFGFAQGRFREKQSGDLCRQSAVSGRGEAVSPSSFPPFRPFSALFRLLRNVKKNDKSIRELPSSERGNPHAGRPICRSGRDGERRRSSCCPPRRILGRPQILCPECFAE